MHSLLDGTSDLAGSNKLGDRMLGQAHIGRFRNGPAFLFVSFVNPQLQDLLVPKDLWWKL
jgi:hypothetical protein